MSKSRYRIVWALAVANQVALIAMFVAFPLIWSEGLVRVAVPVAGVGVGVLMLWALWQWRPGVTR